MNNSIPVSLGICAYNEVANIEKAVRSVFEQILDGFVLKEVIVVSSGSTDGTDDAVKTLKNEFGNLTLIRQEKREGKNSAINCFLNSKSTDMVTMLNADTVFCDEHCFQKLLEPFLDSETGIVGGHPIPTNDKKTVAGFASHMIWTMHHHISLVQPKIGEIIAFRDIGTRLSVNTQSDEDTLKMRLEEKGYKSIYAPDAKVFNRGPETLKDFMKQRTRVNIGECYIKREHDFAVPTWNMRMLYPALIDTVKDLGFSPVKLIISTMAEMYSRIKASLHVRFGKGDIRIWEQVKTTKKL